MTREALSPPKEGRFFTPGIREEHEEVDDSSESLDGDAWEADENGAFVSPKKGKGSFRGEMSGGVTSGVLHADEDALGPSGILRQLTSPETERDIASAFTICHHEVVDLPPTGKFRSPEAVPGTMMPTDGATKGENALPMPVEGSSTKEDVLRAESSQPYQKYNDMSEIPCRPDFAATVGQATRRAARWLIENLLW